MEILIKQIAFHLITIVAVFGFAMFIGAMTTWVERKIVGDMQFRVGVERTGPFGLLQPIADGVKLLFKESIVPQGCDRVTYELAPILSMIPAIMSLAVLPFGDKAWFTIPILNQEFMPYITNLNIGILFVFAWSSLSPYGMIFAGWSSNSKYSLLGALRAAALVISYEIPFGFAVIGVLMLSGSLNLIDIVNQQQNIFDYFIWKQPLAAFVFYICLVAETNRPPFDLSEAESELVAGYFTEYAGMRFSLFFLAEYIAMFVIAAMFTIFFLGGWHSPFGGTPVIPPVLWFIGKTYFFVFAYMWLRATLPRIRYDQMMSFCWKVLLPISIINIFITAIIW